MSFLAITIPISLLLGAIFLALVIREVRSGGFDDMEGPAHRMLFDDDDVPESPGSD
jgi:cbb3-type cytochrome oxidase maturation protein